MGKKLRALLGKNFKTSKFKNLTNSAISRIAYIEKEHKVRCSQAHADVLELLNIGQQERALLRVEHVLREQNMLDAYAMIENYFYLLLERVVFLENNKKCPDELKEAISSLIFAASRCGELPELQKIRELFTSRFGKEFATCAVELRNNCGVNPKIAKKLATRQPSLDRKLKALKEITAANETSQQQKLYVDKQEEQPKSIESGESSADPQLQDDMQDFLVRLKQDENFCETAKARKKYKDAEAAAQAALQFASHAAAAARAAVELSKPHNGNSASQNSSTHGKHAFHFDESLLISEIHVDAKAVSKEKKHRNDGLDSVKIGDSDILNSKTKSKKVAEDKCSGHLEESGDRKKKAELERGIVKNDDGARKKQINETALLKSYFGGESSLRTKSDFDRGLSYENKDDLTYKSPKENLLIQKKGRGHFP
ncbi:hypothetical protein P3X46_029532 [Hevea brasiliensis]|uniref:IST1-like protein n=1 Tax=Hevea brasiliensis TaxID=3981 RepID=A0ABQ9KSH4_HEVBR|nr:uncharacterized protein LOC110637878 isoform X1 [Hevea brasiliensis]KAJ9147358.1 hypothetical protein P3X46_029532 [Hevea brasiliensis]